MQHVRFCSYNPRYRQSFIEQRKPVIDSEFKGLIILAGERGRDLRVKEIDSRNVGRMLKIINQLLPSRYKCLRNAVKIFKKMSYSLHLFYMVLFDNNNVIFLVRLGSLFTLARIK